MFVKLFAAAAAVAALGIGGLYIAIPDEPTYLPGSCASKSATESGPSTTDVCETEGGDCCDAMLAASRAQQIVAAPSKVEVKKTTETPIE